MRTTVISDLHLGAHRNTDVLRRPAPLRALCEALAGTDRLVLLGDALELRQGPMRDALAAAAPVLAELGAALRPEGEIVLVTGNHDHELVQPWLDLRGLDAAHPPLTPAQWLSAADLASSPGLRVLGDAIAPVRLRVAYPGVWLRDDVYALHGHYLDRLTTLPTMERLATGIMSRVVGPVPSERGAATVEHFEAGLHPIYAWMHAVAQSPAGLWSSGSQSVSANAWRQLAAVDGRGSVRDRLVRRGFPVAVAVLNRAGIGPLQADISGERLRRASLNAMAEVVWRLGIEADHVVFGHTHRAGPLPGDDAFEWRVHGSAIQLHNTGSWVDDILQAAGDGDGPYRPGRAVVLDDDGTPPRLVRLVETGV